MKGEFQNKKPKYGSQGRVYVYRRFVSFSKGEREAKERDLAEMDVCRHAKYTMWNFKRHRNRRSF